MMLSMPLVFVIALFFIGACVGSFLNVVVVRSLTGETWMWGRSRCDECKRELSWYELIPIFSFLALRGRCRTCHTEIDFLHPFMEFLTGSLFVWWWVIGFAFFQLGSQPLQAIQALFWLGIGICFLVIIVSDLIAWIIPDWTLVWILVSTVFYRSILITSGIYNTSDFLAALLLGCGFLLFFFALWKGTQGKGMGFGDVKLVFVLGVLLGWPNGLVALSLAFLSGAILGGVYALASNQGRKAALPFGPFLITGSIVALVWGENLVQWYQMLLV